MKLIQEFQKKYFIIKFNQVMEAKIRKWKKA